VPENVRILLVDNSDLFLGLNSLDYGLELFRYKTSPISAIEICNGIDDDCNGIIDDNAVTATVTPSGNINACDGELVTLNAAPTGEDLSYQWFYNGNLINGVTTNSLSSSTLGGSVEVVISSAFGCSDTSDATIVNRIPLPKAKITPQGSLDICSTGSVLLKANSGSGYSYQWILNNVEIPGATKKQYTATAVGNYKVEVTNIDGCNKTSKKVTVVTSCKDPSQLITATDELKLYPNPATNLLQLEIPVQNNDEEQVTITVTNLLGEIAYKEKRLSASSLTIHLPENISNGVYLLTVQATNHLWQQLFEVMQ
jgi:hypothetical protein